MGIRRLTGNLYRKGRSGGFGALQAPATKPPVWFQWFEPISQTDSTTLNPDSQPIFQILFTQRFTQNVVGHSCPHGAPVGGRE
jgi:hypothetical protein